MSGCTDAAVGMMDGAYFTGRKEILDFFNELLDLNLTKIEQTASGAVACQLLDYIFPGSVPMKRVNWEAKSSYEFIQNYKILQAAFSKHRIQKYIDVDKLIRAKYQDNLEFCQWLKAFYDQSGSYRENYDPVAVRAKGKGGRNADSCFNVTGQNKAAPSAATARPGSRQHRAAPVSRKPVASSSSSRAQTKTNKPMMGTGAVRTTKKQPQQQRRQNAADGGAGGGEEAIVADANLMKKNSELMARNAELELTMSTIEKERDFYFEKLRGIEIMLQVHDERCGGENGGGGGVDSVETDALIKRIFRVLYATSDDEVVVDDNGELIEGNAADNENFLHGEDEDEAEVSDELNEELHEELHEDIIGGGEEEELDEDLLTDDLDVHSYED